MSRRFDSVHPDVEDNGVTIETGTDKVARWLIIAWACLTLTVVAVFAAMMWRNTQAITEGQRAIVCVLALDPTDRSDADVHACLVDNGLE